MKKLVLIMGSPRKNGNTARILKSVEEGVKGSFDVDIININDYKIEGCNGCSECQEIDNYSCVLNDDMNSLIDKLISSDAIIYATPLYGHNYSGQMKIFLDRHVPLFKFVEGEDKAVDEMKIISAIENKPVGLIVSCQGPVENNTELISMLFDKFCESSLAKCMGKYVFPFCNHKSSETIYSERTIVNIITDIKRL